MNILNNRIVFLCLGFIQLFFLGCSSGSRIGRNEYPLSMRGSMHDGLYFSSDYYLRVCIPYELGTEEYRYMQFKEKFPSGTDYYVSFGPTISNKDVFRLNVSKRITAEGRAIPISDYSKFIITVFGDELRKAYRSDFKFPDSKPCKVNGFSSLYYCFDQVADANTIEVTPVKLVHHVYIVDYGEAFVCFWVQVRKDSLLPARISHLEFAESLKLGQGPLITSSVLAKSRRDFFDDYPSAFPKSDRSRLGDFLDVFLLNLNSHIYFPNH
jgi:hypothetical protein